jgi:hypothetical protein
MDEIDQAKDMLKGIEAEVKGDRDYEWTQNKILFALAKATVANAKSNEIIADAIKKLVDAAIEKLL